MTVPNDLDRKIIQENGMDPEKYGVKFRDEECIRLLCFATRDVIVIWKGDRKWQ